MKKPIIALAALIFLTIPALSMPTPGQEAAKAQETAKVSRFGEYQGYSAAVYDGSVRTSRYLTMRDGVRLAADIIRPTLHGRVEEKPLPAVFTHTRYRRAAVNREGKVESEADSPFSQNLLRHGYVIVVVDVRGSGASFGVWQGLFSPDETRDAYEVIEWLAAQTWCDGRIGMFGGSYLGSTQLMAASTKPPHLKALFPVVPPFDLYGVAYHNGVFFKDLVKTWSDLTVELDFALPAAPVDEDRDGRRGPALVRPLAQGHRQRDHGRASRPVRGHEVAQGQRVADGADMAHPRGAADELFPSGGGGGASLHRAGEWSRCGGPGRTRPRGGTRREPRPLSR